MNLRLAELLKNYFTSRVPSLAAFSISKVLECCFKFLNDESFASFLLQYKDKSLTVKILMIFLLFKL